MGECGVEPVSPDSVSAKSSSVDTHASVMPAARQRSEHCGCVRPSPACTVHASCPLPAYVEAECGHGRGRSGGGGGGDAILCPKNFFRNLAD